MREEPYLKANLEIVEAKSLVGKGRTEGNSLIYRLCTEFPKLQGELRHSNVNFRCFAVDYASNIVKIQIQLDKSE